MPNLKKTTASAFALLLLLSVFAIADKDTALKETSKNTIPKKAERSIWTHFYVGVGHAFLKMDNNTKKSTASTHSISILAGYDYHQYLAVESRYTTTLNDMNIDQNWDISNIALYLKPKYNTDSLTLYMLLGYGRITWENGTSYSENSFQWGTGANMMATDNIDVFVDYTRLYNDGFDTYTNNDDISVESVNVGVNYNF